MPGYGDSGRGEEALARMPSPTDQEMLDAIRASILKIVTGGQSVAADGRSLTRADLPSLREMEREYSARVSRDTRRHTVARMGEGE